MLLEEEIWISVFGNTAPRHPTKCFSSVEVLPPLQPKPSQWCLCGATMLTSTKLIVAFVSQMTSTACTWDTRSPIGPASSRPNCTQASTATDRTTLTKSGPKVMINLAWSIGSARKASNAAPRSNSARFWQNSSSLPPPNKKMISLKIQMTRWRSSWQRWDLSLTR